jgi:S-adenosylmethionine decarboxylase
MDKHGMARYGRGVEFKNSTAQKKWPEYADHDPSGAGKDHFVCNNDRMFAGKHLIMDFWGARELDDPALMEATLRRCVEAAGATLLHIHLHRFSPTGGLSGVAVLAESHISVHTWPEKGFAAFDIFMCGDACPEMAGTVLKRAFQPRTVTVVEHLRGVIDDR